MHECIIIIIIIIIIIMRYIDVFITFNSLIMFKVSVSILLLLVAWIQ